jgi:hypothetical protein
MAKKKRPCPRGLYDGCPIPRELCGDDFERTGKWHCLRFLKDLEWFVFEDDAPEHSDTEQSEGVTSMEELMRILEFDA